MPDRYYVRQPPLRAWDHVLAHPGTAVTALMCVVMAVLLGVDGMYPGWSASPSLVSIRDWVKMIVAAFLFVGGLLTWAGLVWRPKRIDLSWALERVGWSITVSASLGLSIALVATDPQGLLELVPLSWSLIGVIRIIALRGIERLERDHQASVKSLRIVDHE